jgi:tetratricopeptide (TPR) repeat protein
MTMQIAAARSLSECKAMLRGEGSLGVAIGILLAFLGLFNSPGAPAAQFAQADSSLIGKRVVPRYAGFRLQIENRVINPKAIYYRVEQFNGPWLLLEAERNGPSGWAPDDQVVGVDEANAFFTDCIRFNPGDEFSYSMRASIRCNVTHDLDAALGDYNEAIRLAPWKAYVYTNRGLLWFDKKDYDKAIADDSEAIRLDPKDAVAYSNRGTHWCAKKNYERAIADCNEAIRLDPTYAPAFSNRGLAWLKKDAYDKAIADFT